MGELSAATLLTQATFGPTLDSVATTSLQSYDKWFTDQAAATPTLTLPSVPSRNSDIYPVWLTNAVLSNDQLRQRMAFALSEILVISNNGGPLQYEARSLASYYDILINNSLGNYRTLLEKVTLSPAMGLYLSMFRNDKPDATTGVHADENYAREIMQLFSVGLVQLNIDGTVKLDSSGKPIPTYAQADVENLARVFTGWASNPLQANIENAWKYDYDYVNPMIAYANHHDTGSKTILGGAPVPAGGTPAADLKIALDTIFNHPNVGPFIAKQLIQRLVTSNPSSGYVARVASVFNDNGQGVRGDLLAVAKKILTDNEAVNNAGPGKLREPLLRLTHLWRAFAASDSTGKIMEPQVILSGLSEFAQAPLGSPSVFNFFRPDYLRAGQLTDQGFVAPEFQTLNEKTLVLTENRLQKQAYQFRDGLGVLHAGIDFNQTNILGTTSVVLNTAQWEQYATTSAGLVDKLNLVLMAGKMSTSMRNTLIGYVSVIPAVDAGSRVAETADLIINSPQYAVQH
ncbi:MAG: DUF1800 family protein [Steroidobacteraceae bacterium]